MADQNQMDKWNLLLQSRMYDDQGAALDQQMKEAEALRAGVGKRNYYGWLGGGLNAAADLVDSYNARGKAQSAAAGKEKLSGDMVELLRRYMDMVYGNHPAEPVGPAPSLLPGTENLVGLWPDSNRSSGD